MKCVKCNSEITSDAQFCPYCGTKQNDVIVETEQIKKDVLSSEAKIANEKKSSPSKGNSGSPKKWVWIICALLGLGCLVGWYVINAQKGKSFKVNGVSFNMVRVEGGTFNMGATTEQGDDASNREKPVQTVILNTYYIGEVEVTQELWQAVMGNNPSAFNGSQRPVENVSWNDCQDFIVKLNSLTGSNFRMPTEAEWEFAARGGNNRDYNKYSGSNTIVDDVAWHSGNSNNETHDVAQKSPNGLGLYDMSGNVLEWCQDWYDNYSSDSKMNPTGPSSGSGRVVRGGCWCFDSWSSRVSWRYFVLPNSRGNNCGFRLALDK